MTIYSNQPEVRLTPSLGMPPLTAPLVRPVPLPDGVPGRMFTAGQKIGGSTVVLTVTAEGHWWRSDDPWAAGYRDARRVWRACTPCRGCGAPTAGPGAQARCPKPPSGQDIAYAFLGRYATAVAA